jgi:hypothetical protein
VLIEIGSTIEIAIGAGFDKDPDFDVGPTTGDWSPFGAVAPGRRQPCAPLQHPRLIVLPVADRGGDATPTARLAGRPTLSNLTEANARGSFCGAQFREPPEAEMNTDGGDDG